MTTSRSGIALLRGAERWLLPILVAVAWATPSRAATFTVTNTSASGAGSLGQAITNANAGPDLDTIVFAVPGSAVPTIAGSLPAIAQPVVIDGTTQAAGFVEVRNPGGTALNVTGSGITIGGMVLNSSGTGIGIGPGGGNTVTGCRIGTDPAGTTALANQNGVFIQGASTGNTITNNLVSGNNPNGINIQGSNNVVTGNTIGLDVDGMLRLAGGIGIVINNGSGNRVGGTQAGERNVIAVTSTAVSIQNTGAQNNLIQGNTIGTNAANATGLGGSTGVTFLTAGSGNVLGGAQAGAGNLIVGATSVGVTVLNTSNATIQGNTIGTAALPNTSHGVDMAGADNNTIADNTVSGNGHAGINFRSGADGNTVRNNVIVANSGGGITITGGQQNRLTENSTADNGGLAIDLGVAGVNANDALDADVAPGSNQGQNFPVLSAVSPSQVTGTLSSAADTAFTVEVFASPSCDASGNGEGQTFLGAVQATTDGAGNANLALPLPPTAAGQVLTATATDANGNTSELSACTGPVPGGTTSSTTSSSTTTSSTTSSSTTTSTTTPPTTTSSSTTTSTTTSSTSSTTSSTLGSTSTTSTTVTTSTTTPTTSSTSTSTTSTSTTSSSVVSTTTSSSTTSTSLPAPCAGEGVEPTFRSLDCQLTALLAQVTVTAGLGSSQPRLRRLLERALAREQRAEAACREMKRRRARNFVDDGIRLVARVIRTLRSIRAPRATAGVGPRGVPVDRDALLAAARKLRADFTTFRRGLRCPPPVDDADADGVDDAADKCPATPPGAAVNADGCAATVQGTWGTGYCNDATLCGSLAPSGGVCLDCVLALVSGPLFDCFGDASTCRVAGTTATCDGCLAKGSAATLDCTQATCRTVGTLVACEGARCELRSDNGPIETCPAAGSAPPIVASSATASAEASDAGACDLIVDSGLLDDPSGFSAVILKIEKRTIGGDGSFNFDVRSAGSLLFGIGGLSTEANHADTEEPLYGAGPRSGPITITEGAFGPWTLEDLTCTTLLGSTIAIDKASRTATIASVVEDDIITCTFVNRLTAFNIVRPTIPLVGPEQPYRTRTFGLPPGNRISIGGSNGFLIIDALTGQVPTAGNTVLSFTELGERAAIGALVVEHPLGTGADAIFAYGTNATTRHYVPSTGDFSLIALGLLGNVTDGVHFGGDPGAPGVLWVSNSNNGIGAHVWRDFGTGELILASASAPTLGGGASFPGASGRLVSAFAPDTLRFGTDGQLAPESTGWIAAITDGQPGELWLKNPATVDAAVRIGPVGNDPRRIRCLLGAGLCAVSNFGSDSLTIVQWDGRGAAAVILGTVTVGDGPVGIDLRAEGGNVAVLSTGFNDHSYTITTLGPSGSVVSNPTRPAPDGCTNPGHALWLGDAASTGVVTCNGSDAYALVAQ